MDASTLGAISTVLVTLAFFGVCFWAFSPRLKKRFEEDANLPFADEPPSAVDGQQQDNKQTDDHK
ncbi:CcoQ/FixQ family Cbb3-type cytochrome c oxidase assembly chaperone [Cellvibrio japonicus]|uniref:Cytochrome c oxidase subunit-related protein n=1 Tax=Cellvibrio japonicus (strain Ueda107) TaxID=498211 RepID=B3PLL2_CELJU|nr:CcoQ/FixQ family Cbb3-type cytochrome c oxidase assembly chaperone [Cellvibrio japonicus]ACE83700.1 cytochrome c oxidase subunit-related protein [Cellvibrio japonicus Ueda107]QEI12999.1 CcoQ/FixQ family Cbb3-type cytochrome c oxidase assembly chaperone [Cellvibrio japonicus]QEI16573.1 CcoQ/FixQ family Cbb3-type cytochrome c oxidase assembly chaperone [Cellvibrio japonicus]QEI20151.1 CcoQ/FixQ family Cbb3-type cytochrome c oxidase assembly chaperone [Cellvibrio japonicus]